MYNSLSLGPRFWDSMSRAIGTAGTELLLQSCTESSTGPRGMCWQARQDPSGHRPKRPISHLFVRAISMYVCTSQVEGGCCFPVVGGEGATDSLVPIAFAVPARSGALSGCRNSSGCCCFWTAETGREMRDGQRCRGAVTNDAWPAQHMVTCKPTREAVETSAGL